MKKLVALLLALNLLLALCACGSNTGSASSGSSKSSSSADISIIEDEPEPEPEPEPESEPEPEPEPEPEFTNPLTGEATESDISMNRPVAVMHNTLKKALPQSGPASADILIEATEEGGITRVMGLYQDVTGVGDLGTIRSTREYFSFLAMGYDALLVHCGGSTYGIDALKRHDYQTINQFYLGNYFWRDSWRQKNVGQEHSLYTSGEKLTDYLSTGKIRTTHEEGYTGPFAFTDSAISGGSSARQVLVSYSGYKNTKFVYNADTGKYDVFFFDDEPYMDANTDEQVAVSNVLVVVTKQTTKAGGEGRQEYDFSSGKGYFAWGGEYIEVRWSKGAETNPLVFTTVDGAPLELGVGNSYICIVDDDRPVTFE